MYARLVYMYTYESSGRRQGRNLASKCGELRNSRLFLGQKSSMENSSQVFRFNCCWFVAFCLFTRVVLVLHLQATRTSCLTRTSRKALRVQSAMMFIFGLAHRVRKTSMGLLHTRFAPVEYSTPQCDMCANKIHDFAEGICVTYMYTYMNM